MAYKKSRRLKVYNQSGYRYNPTPTITLKGKWLEELSFPAGTPISQGLNPMEVVQSQNCLRLFHSDLTGRFQSASTVHCCSSRFQ